MNENQRIVPLVPPVNHIEQCKCCKNRFGNGKNNGEKNFPFTCSVQLRGFNQCFRQRTEIITCKHKIKYIDAARQYDRPNCMNSTEIFSATTAAKELDNISPNTIESYVDALVKSNLIYMAYPIAVGSKSVLKGRPKIYIADAAIRNAVLMVDDVLSDERELGLLIETTVYKHLVSFYQGTGAQLGYYRKAKENQKEVDAVIELPQQKILCEVKYKNNSHIPQTDGIVELCNDPKAGITDAFVITKQLEDFGVTRHETSPKIYRIPAIAFLYLIGKEESDGMSGRL